MKNMENLTSITENLKEYFSTQLFGFNTVSFTPLKILTLLVSVLLLFYMSKKLHQFIESSLLARTKMNPGSKYAIASLARYSFLLIGILIILNQAGFNFKSLTVVLGALGVGIGFGLKNIINNFVSGLILLFERPISVGDRVEVEDIEGDVISINPRATMIKTNDNISHIIPNSEFISRRVINWSHGDPKIRRRIPVSVAYGTDPEKVNEILLEVAKEEEAVLNHPPSDVLFTDFGDSSLNFSLRVWTLEFTHRPGVLQSKLNYAIAKKFKEHDIHIPFPQRDIYIKEKP